METSSVNFDDVITVDCRGAFLVAREAARGMQESGGSIIQMSSQMALTNGAEISAYCAPKHAVEGITKSMAIEWAPYGIRVNTTYPNLLKEIRKCVSRLKRRFSCLASPKPRI